MQFHIDFTVDYLMAGPEERLRLAALLRMFQEAAVRHAELRGFGGAEMARRHCAWVMYKLETDICGYPRVGETARVLTTLGGWKGLRAYRHFELWQEGKLLARGLSVWFMIDLESRRPLHITPDLFEAVRTQPGFPPAVPEREWKPGKETSCEREYPQNLRFSDLDANGHVNNTVYADLLETALAWENGGICPPLGNLRIQFNHEISPQVREVRVGIGTAAQGWNFAVMGTELVHAMGEVSLLEKKA
ncbi:MAG: hypothetical protein IK027_00015 [Deltaproteobacteria bacterium]|nr:hypothetical protein [Deltaproteobacteria bacterium]